MVASVVALMYTGRYGMVEKAGFITVVFFTLSTVALAVGLPWTGFGYGGSDLASGLTLSIPAGTLGFAVAMFGITGVGADEMTTYTYWCLEKGYARWTGPDDGTEARARRAEGWIRVMRIDALTSWVVCTLCTLSFYIIGAAILHRQKPVPEGNDMINTLSRMYTDTLGPAGKYLFLIGAIAVLYSNSYHSTASVPRLWTNTLGTARRIRLAERQGPAARYLRAYASSCRPCGLLFSLICRSAMVQVGASRGQPLLLSPVS
ncbi:Manganese transporter OS=Streptomyces antimycoticus OX=68175 GN=SANT12839_084180 PE=4 SV=1 [Streptomyces antimycoticus]